MKRFNLKFLIFIFLIISFSCRIESVKITGDLKKWHKISLEITGPNTSELSTPNPFLDYRLLEKVLP